jgi:Ca-activated chloride channel family protein
VKVRTVACWSALGVILSSAGATAIPLPHGNDPTEELRAEPKAARDIAHFSADGTLGLDARLGHGAIAKDGRGGTYLLAQVTGSDKSSVTAPPLNLAVVIDRSGSMKGDRLANAIAAASGMVERMRDGDSVSVVSFDTQPTVVVPPTLASSATRASIEAAIRSIHLGGDTCISCGLEAGMRELEQTALGPSRVNRMILLSDGATNAGVRDVPGLRAMAGRMRDRGVTISTIGVDVDFDERVMTALAAESNGQHYFVESPSALPRIFSQEFDELLAAVGNDTELAIELAPGVDVEEVFDRSFQRDGRTIRIPFGTFSAKQEKTVLVRLAVPADRDGEVPIADLRLSYRDLVRHADGAVAGSLALVVTTDSSAVQRDLDPFVATRLERSRTAQTLSEVNRLFEAGQVDAALARLRQQQENLKRTEAITRRAPRPTPSPSRNKIDFNDPFETDLGKQRDAVNRAADNIAPPAAPTVAPSSHAGKAGRKENEERSFDLRK